MIRRLYMPDVARSQHLKPCNEGRTSCWVKARCCLTKPSILIPPESRLTEVFKTRKKLSALSLGLSGYLLCPVRSISF
jgi:hypothetical protein